MRKVGIGLDEVKAKISALKGNRVEMNVNRGRKKIDTINGTIKDVYPSVFHCFDRLAKQTNTNIFLL